MASTIRGALQPWTTLLGLEFLQSTAAKSSRDVNAADTQSLYRRMRRNARTSGLRRVRPRLRGQGDGHRPQHPWLEHADVRDCAGFDASVTAFKPDILINLCRAHRPRILRAQRREFVVDQRARSRERCHHRATTRHPGRPDQHRRHRRRRAGRLQRLRACRIRSGSTRSRSTTASSSSSAFARSTSCFAPAG